MKEERDGKREGGGREREEGGREREAYRNGETAYIWELSFG